MSVQKDFIAGLDPTPLSTISASQILQIAQELKTEAYIGLIYYSETSPDVINNPRYAKFLWFKISTKTLYYYDSGTGSWVVVPPPVGAIVTAAIADGSVTLEKLDASGDANQVLAISNTSPKSLDFVDVLGLIGTGAIAINKITPGTNLYFLRTNGSGALEWFNLTGADILSRITEAQLLAMISTNGIALTKLAKGTSFQQLRMDSGGVAPEWFTPSAPPTVPTAFIFPNTSAYDIEPIPSPYVAQGCTFTHNQNAYPKYVRIWVEELGSGLQIPVESCICGTAPYGAGYTGSSDADPHPVQVRIDANTFTVYAEGPDFGFCPAKSAFTQFANSPAIYRWRASAAF